MDQRIHLLICSFVFLGVAAAHVARLILAWDVVVAGRPVPHWISIPGVVIAGLLSVWGFLLASRARSTG